MKRSPLTSLIGGIVLLIIVAAIGFYAAKGNWFSRSGGLGGGVYKESGSHISDYSAVFLTNTQVYFGKIVERNDRQLVLEDIFYLQVNGNSVQPEQKDKNASQDSQVSLVKLGNELHGPQDRMRINQEQIIFTESLKDDSKVVKAIADYHDKND